MFEKINNRSIRTVLKAIDELKEGLITGSLKLREIECKEVLPKAITPNRAHFHVEKDLQISLTFSRIPAKA